MRRRSKKLGDMEQALADLKKSEEQCNKLPSEAKLKELQRDLKSKFDTTKRELEKSEREKHAIKPSKLRSGKKRGARSNLNRQDGDYSDGKWTLKGMEQVHSEKWGEDEVEYLKKEVSKVKAVGDLTWDQLRYLVIHVIFKDLQGIKHGELKSSFHERYKLSEGQCQHDLQSEIKTTLFRNEQKDYLSGMLQELFGCTKKDASGNIKHSDINYVMVVMLAETLIRVVKFVHDFETEEETINFMKKCSREAHGISDDEAG